jgi:mono/diheme cytochrome c family protein
MRSTILIPLASAALLTFALARGEAPVQAQGATAARPTFSETIAPIVYANCVSCHRPGEAAPFALISYDDVRNRGALIATVTQARYMPPWQATHGYGDFDGERRLTDAQIEAISTWVKNGMPPGDPARMPALPKFTDGWQLGTPDLILQMPEEFDVPASGPDIFRNFVIPSGLTEDRWVRAVEFRPSARKVVHHALFASVGGGAFASVNGKDGRPGFRGLAPIGANPAIQGGPLGGWAVGATPRFLPDGQALPMGKGSDFIVQMHFHPSGKAERERSTIGLYFAEKAPERRLRVLQLPGLFGIGAGIDIPAGEKSYVISRSATLPVDVKIYLANPHAHYLGKEFKATATLPDGSTRPLLWIQNWDFNWQDGYNYKEPVILPKGTRVDVTISYDNSATNPRNPSSPPQRVWWGEESTDEMGSIGFGLVPLRREDEAAWDQFALTQLKGTIAAAGQNGTLQRVALNQARGLLAPAGTGRLGGRGAGAGAAPAASPTPAAITTTALPPQVMADLFSGFGGNAGALQRGLDATGATIAANPNHAQALAWHGAATLYYSSTNTDLSGLERIGLFQRATKEMDTAVGIAPDDVRVRMARGIVLRMLTPTMPRLANVPGLIENARADYQRMFDLQQNQLEKLGTHPLGELLQGLAELNSRQNKTADAEKYYGMMQSMLKGTDYAARAAEWMKTKQPLPQAQTNCVSCHQ